MDSNRRNGGLKAAGLAVAWPGGLIRRLAIRIHAVALLPILALLVLVLAPLPLPARLTGGLVAALPSPAPALAITAPELRGQRSLQDLQPDMHGRNLQQQEFIKASLEGFDFHDTDLRGAVFNTSNLRNTNLRGADLEDVVAFSSRFDGADLRGAVFRNAMLMQSRFTGARIEGTDFSDAVLDMPQRKDLCARASGTNPVTGAVTRDSLECR